MKKRAMKYYIDMRGRLGGMENRTMKFVKNDVDRWEVC